MEWMTCPCVNVPHGWKPDRGVRTVSAGPVVSLIDLSRRRWSIFAARSARSCRRACHRRRRCIGQQLCDGGQ